MSERITFHGIERVGPCAPRSESSQYHPRYTRSEWDTYRERERRANRLAALCLLLVVAYALGLVYLLS